MAFQPMPLSRRPAPFDHPEWIFELKYDGFRSLAVIDGDRTQLISRNGQQTEFLKSLSHSSAELREYRQSCNRVRELFAEMAQSNVEQSEAA